MREKYINNNVRVHLKFKKNAYFLQLAMIIAIIYFSFRKFGVLPYNLKMFSIGLVLISIIVFLNSVYKDYIMSKNVENKNLEVVIEFIELKNINNFSRLPKLKLKSKKLSLTPLYGIDIAKLANRSCFIVYDPKTKFLIDIYPSNKNK